MRIAVEVLRALWEVVAIRAVSHSALRHENDAVDERDEGRDDAHGESGCHYPANRPVRTRWHCWTRLVGHAWRVGHACEEEQYVPLPYLPSRSRIATVT